MWCCSSVFPPPSHYCSLAILVTSMQVYSLGSNKRSSLGFEAIFSLSLHSCFYGVHYVMLSKVSSYWNEEGSYGCSQIQGTQEGLNESD